MKESRYFSRAGFFFALYLLVISFLVLEACVRFIYSVPDIYTLTGKKAGKNPIVEWGYLDAFSAYRAKAGQYDEGKTVNRFGFISTPQIDEQKTVDTRIVFLGGSSTAGTAPNLSDEETWPWKVNARMNAAKAGSFDFINAAAGGYTSFESYGRLWARLRFFEPDIIVLYHGWNEMYYFTQVDRIVSWRTLNDGSWTLQRMDHPIKIFTPFWADGVIRWSKALSLIRLFTAERAAVEAGSGNTRLASHYDERGLEIWRTNLKLIKTAADLIGAKLFVIKQATFIVPGLSPQQQKRNRYFLHGFDHEAHVRAFEAIYRVIDQEIRKEYIIDASVLSGEPRFFYDHVHLTPAGTEALARSVADHLLNDLRR